MAITTTTHLNFRGQAREALELYASIFGGQLTAFTYGDAHVDADGAVPDQLMWGGFEAPNGLHLMAFDVPPGRPFSRGEDSVSSRFAATTPTRSRSVSPSWPRAAQSAPRSGRPHGVRRCSACWTTASASPG